MASYRLKRCHHKVGKNEITVVFLCADKNGKGLRMTVTSVGNAEDNGGREEEEKNENKSTL